MNTVSVQSVQIKSTSTFMQRLTVPAHVFLTWIRCCFLFFSSSSWNHRNQYTNTRQIQQLNHHIIRRHLLEKLDDKFFWRFFFSMVGGGIKKNTTIPTKARKEWKKNLLFIDWNTPQPTNSLLCCYYNHFLVTMLVSGIGHAPGTWKGWLHAYSLGTSMCAAGQKR